MIVNGSFVMQYHKDAEGKFGSHVSLHSAHGKLYYTSCIHCAYLCSLFCNTAFWMKEMLINTFTSCLDVCL